MSEREELIARLRERASRYSVHSIERPLLEEAAAALATPSPEAAGSAEAPVAMEVKEIECVSHATGYEEPAESIWRVEIDGYCADFEMETAARNFSAAISRFARSQNFRAGIEAAAKMVRQYEAICESGFAYGSKDPRIDEQGRKAALCRDILHSIEALAPPAGAGEWQAGAEAMMGAANAILAHADAGAWTIYARAILALPLPAAPGDGG